MTSYRILPARSRDHAIMPLLLCLLGAALLSACAGRTSTDSIRTAVAAGNVQKLEEDLKGTHESYGEMVTALNLARVYQLEGRWRESIRAFEDARVLLEEYEGRATVNIRAMLAGAGTAFLSRGAESYFGTGYERSLLHTFNALNYLMLADFSGAAVEMRRMDLRQTLWLEESQARIEKYLEGHKSLASPEGLPENYSMRALLADPDVRKLLNNYQDPFSYSLAAILYRLAGDAQAADVSMRRAIALDDAARGLFSDVWPPASQEDRMPRIPPLPVRGLSPENGKDSPEPTPEDRQEVTLIAFAGLAPSLHVENVRIWFPAIGYILIDLPAYAKAVTSVRPEAVCADNVPATLHLLLRTDLLAYRTLRDELRMEYALAMTRAATRAGVSTAAYAVASSDKDTRAYAPLIGGLATLVMDIFASSMAPSVRNWETLPNAGYIAMTSVPRGAGVTIRTGNDAHRVNVPPDARGVIIIADTLSSNNMKVSHVTY